MQNNKKEGTNIKDIIISILLHITIFQSTAPKEDIEMLKDMKNLFEGLKSSSDFMVETKKYLPKILSVIPQSKEITELMELVLSAKDINELENVTAKILQTLLQTGQEQIIQQLTEQLKKQCKKLPELVPGFPIRHFDLPKAHEDFHLQSIKFSHINPSDVINPFNIPQSVKGFSTHYLTPQLYDMQQDHYQSMLERFKQGLHARDIIIRIIDTVKLETALEADIVMLNNMQNLFKGSKSSSAFMKIIKESLPKILSVIPSSKEITELTEQALKIEEIKQFNEVLYKIFDTLQTPIKAMKELCDVGSRQCTSDMLNEERDFNKLHMSLMLNVKKIEAFPIITNTSGADEIIHHNRTPKCYENPLYNEKQTLAELTQNLQTRSAIIKIIDTVISQNACTEADIAMLNNMQNLFEGLHSSYLMAEIKKYLPEILSVMPLSKEITELTEQVLKIEEIKQFNGVLYKIFDTLQTPIKAMKDGSQYNMQIYSLDTTELEDFSTYDAIIDIINKLKDIVKLQKTAPEEDIKMLNDMKNLFAGLKSSPHLMAAIKNSLPKILSVIPSSQKITELTELASNIEEINQLNEVLGDIFFNLVDEYQKVLKEFNTVENSIRQIIALSNIDDKQRIISLIEKVIIRTDKSKHPLTYQYLQDFINEIPTTQFDVIKAKLTFILNNIVVEQVDEYVEKRRTIILTQKDLLFAIGYKSKDDINKLISDSLECYIKQENKKPLSWNEIFYLLKKFNHLVRTELYIKCIKHYIVNEAHKHDDLDRKCIELVFDLSELTPITFKSEVHEVLQKALQSNMSEDIIKLILSRADHTVVNEFLTFVNTTHKYKNLKDYAYNRKVEISYELQHNAEPLLQIMLGLNVEKVCNDKKELRVLSEMTINDDSQIHRLALSNYKLFGDLYSAIERLFKSYKRSILKDEILIAYITYENYKPSEYKTNISKLIVAFTSNESDKKKAYQKLQFLLIDYNKNRGEAVNPNHIMSFIEVVCETESKSLVEDTIRNILKNLTADERQALIDTQTSFASVIKQELNMNSPSK